MGDFRSIEEADVVMRKLKATGEFKEVSHRTCTNKHTILMSDILLNDFATPERIEALKSSYHQVLTLLGEDPEREGLLKTPERVPRLCLP